MKKGIDIVDDNFSKSIEDIVSYASINAQGKDILSRLQESNVDSNLNWVLVFIDIDDYDKMLNNSINTCLGTIFPDEVSSLEGKRGKTRCVECFGLVNIKENSEARMWANYSLGSYTVYQISDKYYKELSTMLKENIANNWNDIRNYKTDE